MTAHANDYIDTQSEHLDKHVKILAARDAKSRCYGVFAIPQKGLDPEEYATRRGLRVFDFLWYQSVVLRSDQEPALGKVLKSIRAHRGAETQTMLENSPAYVSKANGFIERAIQVVEGQIRTLKTALESKIGRPLPEDACIMPWLVEHAGSLLNLLELWEDGKVPYQRLRGRRMHPALIDFGEAIQFMPLDIHKQGKLTSRTQDGIYPGVDLTSGEFLVGPKGGVPKTRSTHRKPEDQRWILDEIRQLKGTPWKPYQFSDDNNIKLRWPTPIDETEDERRLIANIAER